MRTIIRDNYTPKAGDYHEKIVRDEANNKQWIFDCDGVFTDITDTTSDIEVVNELGESTTAVTSQKLVTDNIELVADNIGILQEEIDELKNSPDVVDIVATYEDLMDYDTSELGDKDVIRVLTDETHDDESSYYRWDKTNSQWVFIGAVEGYYTKDQIDDLLDEKQDTLTPGANISIDSNNVISATDTTYTAGTNVSISSDNVISATDTTYSNFVGTDGIVAGSAGLVPAPATTDAGKFLKADGTWDTAGSAINVVQTTGTSTANVMSQNATTSMVFADPGTKEKVRIGNGATSGNRAIHSVTIGHNASSTQEADIVIGYGARNDSTDNISGNNVLIGRQANATSNSSRGVAIGESSNLTHSFNGVALGGSTSVEANHSVALGSNSKATEKGQVDISTSATTNTYGYNNSQYRLLTGVYDPQSAHDAATKGYVDTAVSGAGGASLTNTEFNTIFGTNLTGGA